MNIEENRLRSFDNWPSNFPVQELAQNGFFGILQPSNIFIVECNWCHRQIDCRIMGQIEDIHKLLEPQCEFVCNYSRCNNVAIERSTIQSQNHSTILNATSTSSDVIQTHRPDLLVEANRLATFENWPNTNISPESLAKAGFFYLNRSDEVKCAWCMGVIAKWEKQDNAFEEHKRFFPNCPRVQLGPLIEIASDGIRDLGIQQISPPKMQKFSSLDSRLRTYTNWPIANVQKPEALAQAGLYYLNVDDHVRCFHCNIGLRSWQKDDDPWFEHAKWYPQCQFVKLVKGIYYVQQVQEATKQCAALQESTNCPIMSIQEVMKTSPVLMALEMGIEDSSIRNVSQKKITSTGRPFSNVEELIQAIFDERREDDDFNYNTNYNEENEGAGASIVRTVSRIINTIFGDVDNNSSTLGSPESNLCHNNTSVNLPGTVHSVLNSSIDTKEMDRSTPSLHIRNMPRSPNSSTSKNVLLEDENSSTSNNISLEDENRKLKDARLCKVCLDDEVGVVFLPCGHLVTCVQCAPGVNQCPMCRTEIKGFVRTFLS